MSLVRCTVCGHAERLDIESASAVASLGDVATRFGVAERSLARHLAKHPRAAVVSAPPTTRDDRRRDSSHASDEANVRNALVALAPPAPDTEQATRSAPVEQASPTEDEEAPATSRSPEISARRPSHAPSGDELEDLMREIRLHLEDARHNSKATYAEKSSLIGKALSAIRLKKQLTGELGQTEAAVLASPRVRRLLADVIEALRPYPDASRAVLARVEGVGEVAA
jgi:hypothetical protein